MKTLTQDIVKSNALIEAVYNPGSVYQMRLLMAALMQVKAKEKLDYRKRYYITANALADMTGSKARNNYQELKKAADALMATTVTITTDPSGKPLANTLKINLSSSCEYIDNEGRVGLRFTEEILPYVSDLKGRFTQYQAQYVMPMRSSYGIRLYELCLQWLGEEREFEVDEFKRLFDLRGNSFSRIEVIKRRVINPALDDINTYSDIRVRFGQRKTGRRVSHFQFMIVRPQPKIKALPIRDWITKYKMHKTGESWEATITRFKPEYNRYKKDPGEWHEAYHRELSERQGKLLD